MKLAKDTLFEILLWALLLVFLFWGSAAFAKDATITLNETEQKAFVALLDSALKCGGLSNLQPVVQFVNKVQKAVAEAGLPPATGSPAPAAPDAKKPAQ